MITARADARGLGTGLGATNVTIYCANFEVYVIFLNNELGRIPW